MISLKIDVTKIDKARLFVGQKGTYLDASLIPTPNNQYGDYMIVQSITKEERESGMKGAILGNGKIIGGGSRPQQQRAPEVRRRPARNAPAPAPAPADDLPEVPF